MLNDADGFIKQHANRKNCCSDRERYMLCTFWLQFSSDYLNVLCTLEGGAGMTTCDVRDCFIYSMLHFSCYVNEMKHAEWFWRQQNLTRFMWYWSDIYKVMKDELNLFVCCM